MSRRIWLFVALFVEGLISLILLLLIPSDPKNSILLGYSASRLASGAILLAAILISLWMVYQYRMEGEAARSLDAFLDGFCLGRRCPILILSVFLAGTLIGFVYIGFWIAYSDLYGAVFLRLAPLVIYLAVVCLQGLYAMRLYIRALPSPIRGLSASLDKITPYYVALYKVRWVLILCAFLVLGYAYYQLTSMHAAQVNQSPQFSDQDTYLAIAEKAYETGFQYKGDRNRTPLYPYLLVSVYKSSMDRMEFFEAGKHFNIVISLVMLVGIFTLARIFLPDIQAGILTFVTAVGLYIYKAGYVQVELLYYTLSFAGYVLMTWMLLRPSVLLGIATGTVTALAYLAKASILPAVALFSVVYVLKYVFSWYKTRRLGSERSGVGVFFRGYILPFLVVLIVFLSLLFPYLYENKQVYGQYFYNVNSTFYMWYDSWAEVEAGTEGHGDEFGWPDLPPEEIPTLGKYLREHTSQQIVQRFINGFESQWNNIIKPYGRFNFIAFYTLGLVIVAILNPCISFGLLRKYWYLVLFFLGYMGGYLLLFAWFSPISDYLDTRFTYGLYLPYLFSIFVALYQIAIQDPQVRIGQLTIRNTLLLWVVHTTAFVLVFVELFAVAPGLLAEHWFGK